MWRHMPVVSATWELSQEEGNPNFKAHLTNLGGPKKLSNTLFSN